MSSPLQPPPPADSDLIDTSFGNEALIEEPVTSGADTSLWDCEPGEPGCEPSEGED